MSADAIKTVAVLGAGTMGNGIAHVFARSGCKVILRDVEKRFLDRGIETIVAVRHPKPGEPGKIAVVSPCGICRELIHDYDAKARVIVPNSGRTPKVVKIGELLPNKYRRGNE